MLLKTPQILAILSAAVIASYVVIGLYREVFGED